MAPFFSSLAYPCLLPLLSHRSDTQFRLAPNEKERIRPWLPPTSMGCPLMCLITTGQGYTDSHGDEDLLLNSGSAPRMSSVHERHCPGSQRCTCIRACCRARCKAEVGKVCTFTTCNCRATGYTAAGHLATQLQGWLHSCRAPGYTAADEPGGPHPGAEQLAHPGVGGNFPGRKQLAQDKLSPRLKGTVEGKSGAGSMRAGELLN